MKGFGQLYKVKVFFGIAFGLESKGWHYCEKRCNWIVLKLSNVKKTSYYLQKQVRYSQGQISSTKWNLMKAVQKVTYVLYSMTNEWNRAKMNTKDAGNLFSLKSIKRGQIKNTAD